ncbi:hypothetical protein L0F63_004193 [Massospora cicadina]|nr:hypothetical protein L0F63_004193 [Massospora cicadina]
MVITVGKVTFLLFDTEPGENYRKAQHALKLAAILLENNIAFKRPIKIYVQRVSPCIEEGRCSAHPALGTPTAFYKVNDAFSPYTLYPQALIKQLSKYRSQFAYTDPIDIKIEINWDYNHYFPMDYPRRFNLDQQDFLDLVLHETLHGLGFVSNFKMREFGFVTTTPTSAGPSKVAFMSTIYDWYLYDSVTHVHFASILNEGIKLNHGTNIGAAIDQTHLTNRYQQITTAALTPNRIIFTSISGQNITLDTGSTPIHSPSHLSIAYKQTQDDIMNPVATRGRGISSYIHNFKSWHASPFGPKTLDILATIGYQLKVPDPTKSLQFYYQFKLQHAGAEPPNFDLGL